jgi:hypothetical protein
LFDHGELGFPNQLRPGGDVHRTRPGTRLRDIAARLDITERSAYGIVAGLTAAGYVIKQKDDRRNRHQIQAHLPLPKTCGGNLDCSSDLAMPDPAR